MPETFDVRYANYETLTALNLKPVTIVSTDGHACPPPEEYRRYLDPAYRDELDNGYFEDVDLCREITGRIGYPHDEKTLDVVDTRGALAAAGEVGFFDPVWRLRHSEAEGIAAEFLHPFGAIGFAPFIDHSNRRRSPELRAAGARAHNRFLEEFCSEAPGRLLGVPLIYPWPDWDAAAEQCAWAAEQGFRAIFPPTTAGVEGDLPPVYDPWWDPMWAACQDHELVVHIHVTFGKPQGSISSLSEALKSIPFDPNKDHQDSMLQLTIGKALESFHERRVLWQLMWGGVFDRFPRLKIAFVEVHGDWVPATLAYLDRKHAEKPGPMRLTPTEYWKRHCAVGASLMRFSDVAARHEMGLEKLMFATDYPHLESTWPNTLDYIRTTLDDIPVDEAKAILGENAINFYGLDRQLLERTAKRVGPLPAEIIGGGHTIDPRLLRHFEFRTGIHKVDTFNAGRMDTVFAEDLAGALAVTAGGR